MIVIGLIKGDTKSLDYSSHELKVGLTAKSSGPVLRACLPVMRPINA